MNAIYSKMLSTGIVFLLVFLFGFWLSRSGKPYSVILFNIHKFIALGALVFLVQMVYKIHQSTPLDNVQIITIAATGFCFIVTIVTGGLLSVDKDMPAFLLKVHQAAPYLTVILSAITLYLLLLPGGQPAVSGPFPDRLTPF